MIGEKKGTKTVIPEDKKLGHAVDAVLRTEEGRTVWAALFRLCRYNQFSVRISRATGDLAPISTEAAAAQRDIYVEMRRWPSRELLIAAENLAEEPIPLVATQIEKEERK